MITVCEVTIRQDCEEALQLLTELVNNVACMSCAPLTNTILSNVVGDHLANCMDCCQRYEVVGRPWTQQDIHLVMQGVRDQ